MRRANHGYARNALKTPDSRCQRQRRETGFGEAGRGSASGGVALPAPAV